MVLLEDLEIRGQEETIQTTAFLRLARILRRVLETWGDSSGKPLANTGVKNLFQETTEHQKTTTDKSSAGHRASVYYSLTSWLGRGQVYLGFLEGCVSFIFYEKEKLSWRP